MKLTLTMKRTLTCAIIGVLLVATAAAIVPYVESPFPTQGLHIHKPQPFADEPSQLLICGSITVYSGVILAWLAKQLKWNAGLVTAFLPLAFLAPWVSLALLVPVALALTGIAVALFLGGSREPLCTISDNRSHPPITHTLKLALIILTLIVVLLVLLAAAFVSLFEHKGIRLGPDARQFSLPILAESRLS